MSIYEKFVEMRKAVKSNRKLGEDFKRDSIYLLSVIVMDTFKNDDQIPKTFTFFSPPYFLGDLETMKKFLEEIVEVKVDSILITELAAETLYRYEVTLI